MAFGLYVHWPFCESKCPYCDFNSHVTTHIDHARWIEAYRAEIARTAADMPDEILSTIFFGGGTPSLMDPSVVEAVIEAATRHWRIGNNLEITMEANPGSVDAVRFADYRRAGVNRISLGIQSLDDKQLRLLGRKHDRMQALGAIEIAQNTFDRVNLDLIYARQHQTPDEWRAELAEAISLGSDHMSLYQLTIEDGTVFGRRHAEGKLPGLPHEDHAVDMYHITQEMTQAAGFRAYEVSNHARPGQECRHNLIYWQGGRYAGVGPGAHGRVVVDGQRLATEAIRTPGGWLDAVARKGTGESVRNALPLPEIQIETLLMGLRLDEGIPKSRLADVGVRFDGWDSLADLIASGHLEQDDTRIRATEDGRILLNSVLARLVEDMPTDQ